jgi:hypothetical protein
VKENLQHMTLTQNSFEKLVESLHSQQTESASLDCKEELCLDLDGDKASFIRDVAALANNVVESYLIIGIQNKTWTEIGLPIGSLFLDPDKTQSRLNQIIENKLDPLLSLRYQVFELKNKIFGVISLVGKNAPYIISISEYKYGGNKSKGQPCFINRGAIYLRHGDTTLIANRQSQILTIQNHINTSDSTFEPDNQLQEFLKKNAYADIESPEFGNNQLSQGLMEKRWIEENQKNEEFPAESYASFIFYPLDGTCNINPNVLLGKLQPENRIGRDSSWFHGLPSPILDMLRSATATPKGIIGKWSGYGGLSADQYFQALSILPNGVIHFSSSYPLFYQNKNVRFYGFVTLIGYLWQLVYTVKAIYKDADYSDNTAVIVNFKGAKNTILADLAKGPQKIWIDVFNWRYNDDPKNINQENNIQVRRDIKLPESSDEQIESMIREISEEIGHYYNQTTPKCFIPDTHEFPVNQFTQSNNW